MTNNEVGFLIVLAFTLGHVTAWIGMWVCWWRR